MENWSVTRKYRTRQGCSPVTTAVASGGVQEDWTTKPSRLASLPQSSLSYCSHRSLTTGLDGLLVWPVRTFLVLFLFPHTNLSALVGSTAKQKIQIQNLSLCTVSIFAHTHTHTRSWTDVTFIIHTSGLSFFSLEIWAVFWEPASWLQETMLLNCCQLLHWNTILSDSQGKQFLTRSPRMCQRLSPVFVCERQANK